MSKPYDPRHFVTQFAEAVREIDEAHDASRALVVNMMVSCRKVLESRNAKTAFPVANLFGNWVVHAELTRGAALLETLQEINREIVGLLAGQGGSGPFGKAMTGTFKFDVLRSELLGVCKRFGVPADPIANERLWARVRRELLIAICDAPIRADRETRTRLIAQYPKAARIVTAVLITQNYGGVWPEPREFGFVIELSEVADPTAQPMRVISQIVF